MSIYNCTMDKKMTKIQKRLKYIKVIMNRKPEMEEYRIFRQNLLKDNVLLMNSTGLVQDSTPHNTLFIVDNRVAANFAAKKGYGYVIYLREDENVKDYSDSIYVINDISFLTGEKLERILLRYLNIPWTILETERCIVREMTEEDTEEIYDIYEMPEIGRYTENFFHSKEEKWRYLRAYREGQYCAREYGMWGIVRKSDSRLIGRAGIYDREGYESPELGYVIDERCRNQGYAKEVTLPIVDYAKNELGMKTLNAFIVKDNIPSKCILKHLGFSWKQHVRIENVVYEWCIRDNT